MSRNSSMANRSDQPYQTFWVGPLHWLLRCQIQEPEMTLSADQIHSHKLQMALQKADGDLQLIRMTCGGDLLIEGGDEIGGTKEVKMCHGRCWTLTDGLQAWAPPPRRLPAWLPMLPLSLECLLCLDYHHLRF
mmetsp:Transcript_54979/g.98009  ORF Transcript_54979/g.98009 Transcript_54979/m.98009 type:complete len:133 (-) Transcript_54979:102-500(-)